MEPFFKTDCQLVQDERPIDHRSCPFIDDMDVCQGKRKNGQPCNNPVSDGQTYCHHHKEQGGIDNIYERLERASPEERTEIVLQLIEKHPDHRLELPVVIDGVRANLRDIDLSHETLSKSISQINDEKPVWWDADFPGVSLREANLYGAMLWGANLQKANLYSANLQKAYLAEANLQGAILMDADLREAFLSGANLQDAFMMGANLHGVRLYKANLQNADLSTTDLQGVIFSYVNLQGASLVEAKLQNLDLLSDDLSHVYIRNAWLEKTRLHRSQLGGAIGEELNKYYEGAKLGYLILKQIFESLGDYEGANWAYRKERRMEKLEAKEKGQEAIQANNWGVAIRNYFKYTSDWFVELLCDYGESVWRVIFWMLALLFVIAPLTITLLGGFVWTDSISEPYMKLPTNIGRFWYNYRLHFLYTLDVFTTASFSGLEPSNNAVRIASGFFSIFGIFLAGLLGFVAGNRIRRS